MNDHEDYLKQFLGAIEWKEGYQSQSIILLCFWTLLCFHPVYTLPCWCYVLYDSPTYLSQHVTFDFGMLSIRAIQTRLSAAGAVWAAVWIALAKWIGMGKIIWLSVTLVLVWNQPIVRFARDAYPRLRTPQPMHSPTVQQAEPLDRYYRFIVIEHQRSWLGKWTTLLLPNERPDWSDEFLQKVPSIQHFCLPPCTIKKDGLDQSVKSSWVWTSHEWHVDFNRNVDKNGWEYGSWDWKTWASKSGLRIFTRRRYWIRHARLEQQKSTAVLIQPKRSLAEDSQSYDSSSLSSLDSIVSTPPSLISHLSKKSSPCHFLETPYASAW